MYSSVVVWWSESRTVWDRTFGGGLGAGLDNSWHFLAFLGAAQPEEASSFANVLAKHLCCVFVSVEPTLSMQDMNHTDLYCKTMSSATLLSRYRCFIPDLECLPTFHYHNHLKNQSPKNTCLRQIPPDPTEVT